MAKREALFNIDSFLKENIKSSNTVDKVKMRMVKNNNRSNKPKTNFARAAHFYF